MSKNHLSETYVSRGTTRYSGQMGHWVIHRVMPFLGEQSHRCDHLYRHGSDHQGLSNQGTQREAMGHGVFGDAVVSYSLVTNH